MIICAKCGAEAEGGATCPRCGSALPADRSAKALTLASSIIGAACGLSASAGLLVDYARNGSFGWSLVGLASSALAWLLVGFPFLTYRRPALFLPVMGAGSIAYLWALDALTGGRRWFLPIALPIALAAMASGALSTLLCLKAKRRGPNVGAFVLIGCALTCLAVDAILSSRIGGAASLTWSAIVAASALPVAGLLLGIQQRLRQPEPEPEPVAPQPLPANSSSK
jgi:hypothetical protein